MGNGEGVLAGVLFFLFGIPILFVICAVVFGELKQEIKDDKTREECKRLGIDPLDTSNCSLKRSRGSCQGNSNNRSSSSSSSSWSTADDFHWNGLL